jgi:hypothetical protein
VQQVASEIKGTGSVDDGIAVFFAYLINPSYGPEFFISSIEQWPETRLSGNEMLPEFMRFSLKTASWGHDTNLFGDADEMRHIVGSFLVAERHGWLPSTLAGGGNELMINVVLDIANIRNRPNGGQWAFQPHDLWNNQKGIALWELYRINGMLRYFKGE